jgi:RecB family exonuclease
LETFFRHEPGMRTYEVLEASLVRAWRRITASRPLESDLERAHHLERGRVLLQIFVTSFDLAARPLRLEQALELRLRTGTRIRTRLDRIDPWGEGVRVVDYKTGTLQLDSRDIARDTASIIHLLAAEHAGYRVERLSFLYLSTGEEVYWEPERDDVDFAAERLRDLLRTVRDDLEFPPVPGEMCGFCPFRDRCDAAKLPEPVARRTLRPLDALGSKHAQ